MVKINMNTNGEQRNVFKALPKGDYNANIISTTLSLEKRPTLIVEFQLIGEKSVNGAMLNNRKEKYRILLDSEYTVKILKNLFEATDYHYGDELDVEQLVKESELVGKMCTVHLDETTFLGRDGQQKPCNRVKYVKKFDFNTLA